MFARTTCRIRNASRQASRESELATFTCCAYDTPWSDFGKSFFLLMLLTWLLIKHSHTHTHRETLEEPQILTAVEWRQASHLVIESGNLNESAGNAIDMTIVITIDIDNDNGKAIIVVVLPRHKPHRHCHYSAAFAITPLLAWMSVCGLRTARSESTSCRLALASEYLNLILTFIMHTQEAHISVPLSISACLSLSFPLWLQITCAIWFHFRSAAAALLVIKLLDLFRFIFGFDVLADDEKCLQLIDWQLAAVECA